MNARRALLFALALFTFGGVSMLIPTTSSALDPETSPQLICAYAFFLSNYSPEFPKVLDDRNAKDFFGDFRRLNRSLEAFGDGRVPTDIAFAGPCFVVQGAITGQVSGFVKIKGKTLEQSKVSDETLLFVTTPIDQFGGKVLFIVSGVGPDRTWIIALDPSLNAQLLYYSFADKHVRISGLQSDDQQIGSIYQVRVSAPGVFSLEERRDPSGRGLEKFFPPRRYVIDVSKGHFEISGRQIFNQ